MTKENCPPEVDLEEDAAALAAAVERLRSLVDQEQLLRVRKDDIFLLRYLRSAQYSPEVAFQKMRTYYAHKCRHPDWYVTEESLESFEPELAEHLYFVLEDRDRAGKRVYVNKLGMIDASKTTMTRQSQVQDFFLECVLDEEETQKNGLSVVVDLKNFSWTLLRWLTPANVSVAVKKVETLPVKKIEFHVVNTSALLNAAIKLIWPFLSARTKENIHFHHEDWPSLHKAIDPRILPHCYGGTKAVNVEKLLRAVPGSGSKERLSGNLRLGYLRDPDT